jgi:Flp pilus assembly protein TadD
LLASLPSQSEGEVRQAPASCGGPLRVDGGPIGIPESGDLHEMVAALQAELDQAPQDLPAWERLAALTELTDSPEVETVILRAYRSFPQGSRILDGLWDISHQDDPALSAAERAARTGQLLAASGDWRLAGAAWSRAVALEPVFPQAQAYLGLATSRTGGDGLPLLLEAMQQAPEDPVVRSLLGQYWLGAGSPADAVRELSHAHRLDPASPAISAALGAAFAQAGRLEEASEAYRQAAVHDPQDPDFWLLLAEFSLRYDFEVESIGREAARNAVALSPQDSNARSALGTANVIAGDLVAGEQLLHEAITLDPANALAWYRFALFLLDEGRVDEARRALSTAAALEPSGVVAQLSTASLANLETGYR